jgi:ABC-2 type transport system permease protein
MLPYLRFEVLRILRDRRYLLFTVAFPLGIYLLFTHVNDAGQRDGGITLASYLLVAMAAYGAMGATLAAGSARMAAERSSGWIRQLRATPLPAHGYLTVKLAAGMLLALPALLLVALAGALVNGVHLPPLHWVELLGLLWLGALPFAGLGIVLGCLLDATSSQPAMVGTYMLLAVLGGMWAPIDSMPGALRAAAHALPSYHFADLGWRAVAGSAPAPADLLTLAAYAAGFGALAIWAWRRRVAAR